MRADRLISLIMLLQARGKLTAGELAVELGVSERTIYRDMIALSSAGIPVYGSAGLEGGYSLVDSYRTNLTGLTPGEVRALFMLRVPEPLTALGMDQELKSALRKLAAALPDNRRVDEERAQQRFYLDANWWRQGSSPAPYLHTLHQAVWQDRCVHLTYHPLANVTLDQVVEAYGLVAKAGAWYLVCRFQEKIRVYAVSDLYDVQLIDQSFTRLPDFHLAVFWSTWCTEVEQGYLNYPVSIRVSPTILPWLPHFLGSAVHEDDMRSVSQPDLDGWTHLEILFESLDEARSRLLGLGGGVEVLAPRALRLSLLDYARQVVGRYAATDAG